MLYQYQFQCVRLSVNNHLITGRCPAPLSLTSPAWRHSGGNSDSVRGKSLDRAGPGSGGFCSSCQSFSGNWLLIKQTIEAGFKYPVSGLMRCSLCEESPELRESASGPWASSLAGAQCGSARLDRKVLLAGGPRDK